MPVPTLSRGAESQPSPRSVLGPEAGGKRCRAEQGGVRTPV